MARNPKTDPQTIWMISVWVNSVPAVGFFFARDASVTFKVEFDTIGAARLPATQSSRMFRIREDMLGIAMLLIL